MAKKSEGSEKLPARARQRAKRELIKMASIVIADIIDMYSEWMKLTGGSAAGEVPLAESVEELEAHFWPGHIANMRPMLIRLAAQDHWNQLDDLLMGWARTAEIEHEELMAGISQKMPGYRPPQNQERSRLARALRRTPRREDGKPYARVLLPTALCGTATEGLMKLDYGEVDPIFEPAPRKSFKDGYTIPTLRDELLTCAHYQYGKGRSMAEAYSLSASAANVTAEAVRNWERAELSRRRDEGSNEYPFEWIQAEIKGAHDAGLNKANARHRLHAKVSEDDFGRWWAECDTSKSWFAGDADMVRVGKEYQVALKAQAESARRVRGKR